MPCRRVAGRAQRYSWGPASSSFVVNNVSVVVGLFFPRCLFLFWVILFRFVCFFGWSWVFLSSLLVSSFFLLSFGFSFVSFYSFWRFFFWSALFLFLAPSAFRSFFRSTCQSFFLLSLSSFFLAYAPRGGWSCAKPCLALPFIASASGMSSAASRRPPAQTGHPGNR